MDADGADPRRNVQSAEGGFVVNADGRRRMDFDLLGGALLLGHPGKSPEAGRPDGGGVVRGADAVTGLARRFAHFPHWCLFPSRGEAFRCAVDHARRVTGRREIVRFFGSVHGSGDSRVAGPSRGGQSPLPFKAGIAGLHPPTDPEGQTFLKYSDSATVESYLHRGGASGSGVAAVFVSPVGLRGELRLPAPDFLPRLRAATSETGTLLLFDEGDSGFRFGPMGAGYRFGVVPDGLMLGEASADGHGMGALAVGVGPVVAGEGQADPGAPALAALVRQLAATEDPNLQISLDSLGARLARGLESIGYDFELPLEVDRLGSCVSLVFPRAPGGGRWSRGGSAYKSLVAGLFSADIFLPAVPGAPWFVCTDHGVDGIDRAIVTFREVLESCDSQPGPAKFL
jgi:glutamate-1-semialdehyde 2,1-aminomutase